MSFKIVSFLESISGCGIRDTFGIYCPGCGGTRAVFALLDGNVLASLQYNPIPVLLIVDLMLIGVSLCVEKIRNTENKYLKLRITANVILLAIIVFNFIARNYLLIFKGIDTLGDFS